MNSPEVVAGNTAFTKPENKVVYPALDGLRALAFFIVFAQHYLKLPWGWTGVDLFFVLSGFLITGILFDTQDDPHRYRNFYVRRVLRIFPLYYGVMLALVFAGFVVHWNWNAQWLVWPLYAGNFARFLHPYALGDPIQQLADFQPNGHFAGHQVVLYLGHFWSLCVEEQFYLFWPFIVFWTRSRRRLAWICAISIPSCLAARVAASAILPAWMLHGEVLYRATPFRLDALLMGGLLALILRGPAKSVMLRLARLAVPVALVCGLLWIILSPYGHIWRRGYVYPPWRFTWGLLAVDICSAILIGAAIQPNSMVFRIFAISPLRWLGRISYGLYVFHDIFHFELSALATKILSHTAIGHNIHSIAYSLASRLLLGAMGMGLSILLAWLSFRFFETPFLNLKEKWTIRGSQFRQEQNRASLVPDPVAEREM